LSASNGQTKEATTNEGTATKALDNLVRIDEEHFRDHPGKIVRGGVEETLNALMDAEAEKRRDRPRRVFC
jgi:hypothetical protein